MLISHVSFFVLPLRRPPTSLFFFFNDTATTEIYTLSLHDALPIWADLEYDLPDPSERQRIDEIIFQELVKGVLRTERSEEHTSELQSPCNLVCRLLLEKKKKNTDTSLLPSRAS